MKDRKIKFFWGQKSYGWEGVGCYTKKKKKMEVSGKGEKGLEGFSWGGGDWVLLLYYYFSFLFPFYLNGAFHYHTPTSPSLSLSLLHYFSFILTFSFPFHIREITPAIQNATRHPFLPPSIFFTKLVLYFFLLFYIFDKKKYFHCISYIWKHIFVVYLCF